MAEYQQNLQIYGYLYRMSFYILHIKRGGYIITSIFVKSQDDSRFYFAWGLIAVVFGLSLIVATTLSNLSLGITVFFIGSGLTTLLIGLLNPVLPSIIPYGFIFILLGFLIYGIFVALLDPILIFGLTVIGIGVCIIIFLSKRGLRND